MVVTYDFLCSKAAHLLVIDLFGSLRSTTAVLLVGASFSSPIVLHASGHMPKVSSALSAAHKTTGTATPTSPLVVSGREFAVPLTWGAIPGSQLPSAGEASAVGSVVSGVCPGGRVGGSCAGDVDVTFVTYDAKANFPSLVDVEATFDRDFGRSMRGFHKVKAEQRTDSGGDRWMRYEFTYTGDQGIVRHEVLGVWRASSGNAVVAIAVGPQRTYAQSAKAIDTFMTSTHPSSA